MKKIINTNEMAQIVAGLLVQSDALPRVFNEKERLEFLKDIGQVVTKHALGDFTGIFESVDDGPQFVVNTAQANIQPDVWSYHGNTNGIEYNKEINALKACLLGDTFDLPFTLEPYESGAPINGTFRVANDGLSIGFDGHSDRCSDDFNGSPIFIHNCGNQVKVLLYSDINSEVPVISHSLENSRVENRDDDLQEVER